MSHPPPSTEPATPAVRLLVVGVFDDEVRAMQAVEALHVWRRARRQLGIRPIAVAGRRSSGATTCRTWGVLRPRRGGHHRSPRVARLGPVCDDRSSFRGRGPAGRGRPARARFAGALSVATALRRSRRLTWLAVAAVAVVLLGLALTLVALSARS